MKKHQRRSIRLRGYDYTRAGAYFLTMCVQDRSCLFGEIDAGTLQLNDAGHRIEHWWLELNNKFPGVETDGFVVMPNHVHGIIVLADPIDHDDPHAANDDVGADLRVRPHNDDDDNDDNDDPHAINERRKHDIQQGGGHIGPPLRNRGATDRVAVPDRAATDRVAVGTVVQWFKTMATNEYIRGVRTLSRHSMGAYGNATIGNASFAMQMNWRASGDTSPTIPVSGGTIATTPMAGWLPPSLDSELLRIEGWWSTMRSTRPLARRALHC